MDQSDPVAANVAVRKARERARDFARDEMRTGAAWRGGGVEGRGISG